MTYEYVTCTEVVEHFYYPRRDVKRLADLLAPGGWLVIMTDHRVEDRDFEKWGYRTDSTHVCFYNEKTWRWVARWAELDLVSFEGRLVVFQKPQERQMVAKGKGGFLREVPKEPPAESQDSPRADL